MSQTTLSIDQSFALDEEARNATFLIQEGLIAIGRISGANDFWHGPLQLLAQGFERLMKIVVALYDLETAGSLPQSKTIRSRYGHDLARLGEEVVRIADESGYSSSRLAAGQDRDFLATDPWVKSFMALLSSFGERDRYYNLGVFLDGSAVSSEKDPRAMLDKIEREFLETRPELSGKMGSAEFFQDFYPAYVAHVTGVLQRMARALSRFFTLGPLGRAGQQQLGAVKPFLLLMDKDLREVPKRWYERGASTS